MLGSKARKWWVLLILTAVVAASAVTAPSAARPAPGRSASA